jgi:hypothetical protein
VGSVVWTCVSSVDPPSAILLVWCPDGTSASHCSVLCSGDADLYMSSTITRPTAEHSTWISASIGTDSVVLTTDHPDWDTRSPALYLGKGTAVSAIQTLCMIARLVAGIYGRYASEYTLNVSIRVAPNSKTAGKRLRGRG